MHFTGRRVSLEGVKPVTGNGGKNAHKHTPKVLEVFWFRWFSSGFLFRFLVTGSAIHTMAMLSYQRVKWAVMIFYHGAGKEVGCFGDHPQSTTCIQWLSCSSRVMWKIGWQPSKSIFWWFYHSFLYEMGFPKGWAHSQFCPNHCCEGGHATRCREVGRSGRA